jgi:hypothetical protein
MTFKIKHLWWEPVSNLRQVSNAVIHIVGLNFKNSLLNKSALIDVSEDNMVLNFQSIRKISEDVNHLKITTVSSPKKIHPPFPFNSVLPNLTSISFCLDTKCYLRQEIGHKVIWDNIKLFFDFEHE